MALDKSDPEVLALIEEVTAKATEALSKNNAKLLEELRVAKAKAKGVEIDPADHEALKTKIDELTGELKTAGRASKAEIERLSKSLTEKDGALNKHLIESSLTDSLVKAGVQPGFLDAVKALHQSKASIEVKDGAYNALIDGKPISDYVTTWAQSDQGKHFVSAPNNNGGGAQGGKEGKAQAKTITRAEYDTRTQANDGSLIGFFREGGLIAE